MKTFIFVLLATLSTALPAAPMFEDIVEDEDQHISRKSGSSEAEPLGIDGLPAYPDDNNLRRLNIRHSSLIFYVDISSIRSGIKDNIVRSVIVAISSHGARTVRYEGFDCGYRRYQAYGYGGTDESLRPFPDQGWKPIIDEENGRYRRTLVDNYFCQGFAYAASREKILSRMQNLKPYVKN